MDAEQDRKMPVFSGLKHLEGHRSNKIDLLGVDVRDTGKEAQYTEAWRKEMPLTTPIWRPYQAATSGSWMGRGSCDFI